MEMYALKFEIKSDDKQHIINAYDLEFLYETSVQSTEIKNDIEKQHDTLIESGGTTQYQQEIFKQNSNVFQRVINDISSDHAAQHNLRSRMAGKPRSIIKQAYGWQGTGVQVNFLWFDNSSHNVELECTCENLANLDVVKERLSQIGITRIISEIKKAKLKSSRTLVILVVFGCLLIVFTGIVVWIFFREPDQSQKKCNEVDVTNAVIGTAELYCLGNLCSEICDGFDCHDVSMQSECITIDVVDYQLQPYSDGVIDCTWNGAESNGVPSDCAPVW
ncbi:MAG: hypothetical protein WC505_02830 [Patescibacteria group bacterium]